MDRRIVLPLLTLCLVLAQCEELVPVIGWSDSDVTFSSVHGNEFTNANEFIFKASLDSAEMVVIFDAPELSFDSLAKYGGIYGGKDLGLGSIQSEMKNSRSSIWAGAEGDVAPDLLATLSSIMDTKPLVIQDAADLTFHKLVRVQLPASSEENGFSLQDAVISEVMSAVHSLPNSPSYAALYTSHVSASPQHGELRRKRNANKVFQRDVDADEDNDEPKCYSVYNSNSTEPCLLFCFSNTTIFRSLNNQSTTTNKTELTDVTFLEGSCSNDSELCRNFGGGSCISVSAQVIHNDTDIEDDVNFIFSFQNGYCSDGNGGSSSSLNCGFWTMDVFITDTFVTEEKYRRSREETKIFTSFAIPVGTSYACGDNLLNVYNVSTENVNGTINENNITAYAYYFTGIQVQAFSTISLVKDGSTPSFSSAYNCQSYVSTVPIMGFIAVLVLVIVLYCTIAFIFGIQSPDRFDDPRGPTITVENLH